MLLYIFVVALVFLLLYRVSLIGKRGANLPPGPPTVPLLGNLHQIPKSRPHFQLTKWAEQYGGIFSLKMGPGTMVVITDRQIARALLDSKGAMYSDRPVSYVMQNLITAGDHPLVMGYGPKWRRARRTLHQEFQETRCDEKYLSVLNAESVQMLRDFLIHPEKLMLHPKRFTNSLLMSIVYGVRTPTPETKHMSDLYNLIEIWAEVGEPGATPPVEILPIFKYLPEKIWSNWKSRSLAVNQAMDRLHGGLMGQALERHENGHRNETIVDNILDEQASQPRSRGELNFICGTMMEAGSDTSSSMILACIQAMTVYPQVQRKAQAEIDAVVPSDRSPTWDDFERLPYIVQVIKETMRWRPTAPLAFPHSVTADDYYNGMLIPKGSIVILNTWGLHHPKDMSPPPHVFDPERFAGCTKPAAEYFTTRDPATRDHYGYGAGRRICPGVHLAERMMFVGIAKLLWAFSFEREVGADGRQLEINVDFETGYTHGFVHGPKPFPAAVRIRGEQKRMTILREYETANRETLSHIKIPDAA